SRDQLERVAQVVDQPGLGGLVAQGNRTAKVDQLAAIDPCVRRTAIDERGQDREPRLHLVELDENARLETPIDARQPLASHLDRHPTSELWEDLATQLRELVRGVAAGERK